MSKKKVIIKLGGASLQEPSTLRGVIETIRGYRKYDYNVIVVHGGGPAINEELVRRGIEWQFINGQRQTTNEMMSVIEEVLAKKVNGLLVEQFKQAFIPAVGFSGAENHTLLCEQADPELGQVGQVVAVNTLWIERLLNASGAIVPIIAPIGVGENGEKYNINADWAATKMAAALKAEKLIFLTDQKGILNPDGQLIPKVSAEGLSDLVEAKVVTGGMYTKVLTVLEALKNGVPEVRIMSGKDAGSGLWSDLVGTSAYV